jgi:antitoxin component YwqK of YwqJK toxin-antitoxin module
MELNQSYYLNGQIEFEKYFRTFEDKKIPYGTWRFWYRDGRQHKIIHYDKHGRKTGVWKTWYENPRDAESLMCVQLHTEYTFENDLHNGFAREFFENGKRKFEGKLKDGEYIGLCRHWNMNGEIISEINYPEIKKW